MDVQVRTPQFHLGREISYLRVILGIPRVQCDRLEVQPTIDIDRRDNVPLNERKPFSRCSSFSREDKASNGATTHCKVGTMPLTPVPDPAAVAPGVAAGVLGVTPLPAASALSVTPFEGCC